MISPARICLCIFALTWGGSIVRAHAAEDAPNSGEKRQPTERPSVALDKGGENRGNWGPLYHQILQEAFLATARDEFGAITFDATLREPVRGSQKPSVWEVISNFDPTHLHFELTLNHKPGESGKRVFKHKLTIEKADADAMEQEIALAERTMHHEFFDALRAENFTPQPRPWHADGAAPKDIEALLSNLCLPAQFDAIRKLHAQIEAEGESPERLSALARAYANLGLLTEHLWTTSTKALTARSLVYAQRLCAKQPDSAEALWCRGYVRAIAGRQHTALADFAAAHQIAAKSNTATPPWAMLAEAFCKFDSKALQDDVPKRYEPLSRLLYYLAVEPTKVFEYLEAIANSLLETIPDAYRPLDLIAADKEHWAKVGEGASYGHVASAGYVYAELDQLDDLPEGVRKVCKDAIGVDPGSEHPFRGMLFRSLRDASKPAAGSAKLGEPSWGALATLLEDVALAQVCRSLNVDKKPDEELLQEMMPLFDEHPFRTLLGLHSNNRLLLDTAMQNADKMGVAGLTMNAEPLIEPLEWIKWPLYSKLCGSIRARADDTFYDQWRFYQKVQDEDRDDVLVEHLLKIAPNMPVTVDGLLARKQKRAAPHAGEWETQYAEVPDFLIHVGRFYRDEGKYEDAIRVLRQEIEAYPDHEAFSILADTYLRQGDEKKWQATWDDYFDKVPEFGSNHLETAKMIVWHFMGERKWSDAWTYAQQKMLADPDSALEMSACCAEAQQKWDVAEQMFSKRSKEHDHPFEWYAFCRRTGKGDLAEARETVEKSITLFDPASQSLPPFYYPAYYSMNRKFDEAYQWMRSRTDKENHPILCLHCALLADRLNDAPARDALLRKVLVEGPLHTPDYDGKSEVEVIALTELLVDDLAAGGKGKIDLDEAARRCASATQWSRSAFYYFLGEYLDIHGQPDAAIQCWRQAMLDPRANAMFRTLAGTRLTDKNISPDSYSKELQTPLTLEQAKRAAPPKLRHPPDAKEFDGHFYKFFTDNEQSWTAAEKQAEKMGGTLACVTSEKEQEFVAELCRKRIAWLGGYREEGKWNWVTGEPFEYANWGHPQIVEKHTKTTAAGTWVGGANYPQQAGGFVVEWEK